MRGEARASLPPVSLVLASMLLLVLAEVGGASMVKFKNSIERANRERIEARADVHGLFMPKGLLGTLRPARAAPAPAEETE